MAGYLTSSALANYMQAGAQSTPRSPWEPALKRAAEWAGYKIGHGIGDANRWLASAASQALSNPQDAPVKLMAGIVNAAKLAGNLMSRYLPAPRRPGPSSGYVPTYLQPSPSPVAQPVQTNTPAMPWPRMRPAPSWGTLPNMMIGNQLGAFMSFPAMMQGAMGQIAAINRANQLASLRLRELETARAMEQARLSAINRILGSSPPSYQLPQIPLPQVEQGTVWRPIPQLPAIPGLEAGGPDDLHQMASEAAGQAAMAARAGLNLSGAPAEAAQQLNAATQQARAQQALWALARQIYGSQLNDQLARMRIALGAL